MERLDAGPFDAAGTDAGTDACLARDEICNGLDDDCDGAPDDGIACFFLDGEPVEALRTSTCGAAWYSYGTPDSQSANPTPDIRRSGGVVVAIQYGPTCAGASVVLITDLPDDGSGGELQVSFVVTPPDAAGLLVSDEDDECLYDTASGTGRCDFAWVACCTDGVLLGAFDGDACVELEAGFEMGLEEGMFFLDGSGREIPRAFGDAMLICAQIRPAVP